MLVLGSVSCGYPSQVQFQDPENAVLPPGGQNRVVSAGIDARSLMHLDATRIRTAACRGRRDRLHERADASVRALPSTGIDDGRRAETSRGKATTGASARGFSSVLAVHAARRTGIPARGTSPRSRCWFRRRWAGLDAGSTSTVRRAYRRRREPNAPVPDGRLPSKSVTFGAVLVLCLVP